MDQWKLQPARDLGLPLGKRLQSVHRESGLVPWLVHISCWSMVHVSFRLFHRLRIEGGEFIPADRLVRACGQSLQPSRRPGPGIVPALASAGQRLPDRRGRYFLSDADRGSDVGGVHQRLADVAKECRLAFAGRSPRPPRRRAVRVHRLPGRNPKPGWHDVPFQGRSGNASGRHIRSCRSVPIVGDLRRFASRPPLAEAPCDSFTDRPAAHVSDGHE